MARRLILHVGTMKSGTSFVQNVLAHHKDRLLEDGVLFAGPRWRAQVSAVQELIEHGGPEQPPLAADGPWRRLAREIDDFDGTAVISMEFLAPRNEQKIGQILATFPDTDVRVVITCRDLGRTIPAMWQEMVQNGGVVDWEDYLESVRRRKRGDGVARRFWKHHDVPQIADRWAGAVGQDKLTLVTLPPPGAAPDTLWRRFCEATGIEAEDYDLDVRANPSIGLASAVLLMHLNRHLQEKYDGKPDYYETYVKHELSKRSLVHRSKAEPKLGFSAKWAGKLGEAHIHKLQKAGHRVVGDLHDLQPVDVPGVGPEALSAQDILDAALAGIDRALDGWSGAAQDARKARRKLGSRS